MSTALNPIINNKTWLQGQLEKFIEDLYVNVAYTFSDVIDVRSDDPMITLAKSRIHIFKHSIPNKDEYGKHFLVGMEVIKFLEGKFVELGRKRELLTDEEKRKVENTFYFLINKVTDDIETAIKKVFATPAFKSYFKIGAEDIDFDEDEEEDDD